MSYSGRKIFFTLALEPDFCDYCNGFGNISKFLFVVSFFINQKSQDIAEY